MALWLLAVVTLGTMVMSSDALEAVYTRAYAGKDLGVARKYHAQYWEIARKSKYLTFEKWSSMFRCANYEANEQGAYMGFFFCPRWFEPNNFKHCCGKQGAHYCCPNSSLATPYLSDPDADPGLAGWAIALIVLGVLFALFLPVIVIAICFCAAGCCFADAGEVRARPVILRSRNRVTGTVATAPYPVQQSTAPPYPQTQQPTAIPYPPPTYDAAVAYPMNTAPGTNFSTGPPPPSYSSAVQQS